jgi:hypothetical protein
MRKVVEIEIGAVVERNRDRTVQSCERAIDERPGDFAHGNHAHAERVQPLQVRREREMVVRRIRGAFHANRVVGEHRNGRRARHAAPRVRRG